MDKKQLNKYFWLTLEIKKQERRLERLNKKSSEIVTDIVSGSSDQFPYTAMHFKIEGNKEYLVEKMKRSIEHSIEKAIQTRLEISDYIDGIEDPRMREIMRDRFIECLQWDEIGQRNFCSSDHSRKLVRAYLKNIS